MSEVQRHLTHAEWMREGRERFGQDPHDWKFTCPSCGYVVSVRDYKEAGAREGQVGFVCIGRFLEGKVAKMFERPGPCDYSGGGLIRLNPVRVELPDGSYRDTFEWAEPSQPSRRTVEQIVDSWNARHAPGTEVLLTDDLGVVTRTRTRSSAWLFRGRMPVVLLDGRTGEFLLERIQPAGARS